MHYIKKHKLLSIILVVLSIFLYQNYTRIVPTNNKVNKRSSQYVNDLYMSDASIYNKYLNKREKEIYMLLLNNTKKFKSNVNINTDNFRSMDECISAIEKAHYALMTDHPELMNYATCSWTYNDEDPNLHLKIIFAFQNPIKEYVAVQRIQRIIFDIKEKTNKMTDLQKIKYVYNWIGEHEKYDRVFTFTSKNQSIYNVFMKNNAVCAGFAKASQVIFQNIGIESSTIVGASTDEHMWNVIKYQGKYYYFDSTIAASIKKKENQRYNNGLLQTEMNDYTINYPEWYKTIEKTNIKNITK